MRLWRTRFSLLDDDLDLDVGEDFDQWLDDEFDGATTSPPPTAQPVIDTDPIEDYAADESDEDAERMGLAAKRAAGAALRTEHPTGQQIEYKRFIAQLNETHQRYIDGHFGEVYRTGDDTELDALHDRRLAFFGELIPDAHEYPKAYAVWRDWFETEQRRLQHPEVRSRLTTQQRRARGFGDTKQLD